MAINFPDNPTLNDTYTYNGKTWKWNGSAWEKSSATETGNTEGNTGEVAYYGAIGSVIKGATAFLYDDTSGIVSFNNGLSAGGGATFANDINVNDLTIGHGGGDISTNTALGEDALVSNTAGRTNVASGYRSLYSNTDGGGNVASGYQSLYLNTTGNYNVASGHTSLFLNTTGNNNSALGYNAGYNGTTGSNNTYIGYNAQPSHATASNEIVLGDSNVTLIHSVAGMSMGGGATFGGDVNITGSGNYLQFPDGTTQATAHTATSVALDDITDTTISGYLLNKEILAYNTGSGKWINQTASDLSLALSTHTHTLNDLSDVDTTGSFPTGAFISYDGVSGGWFATEYSKNSFAEINNNNTYTGTNSFNNVVYFNSSIVGLSADADATFGGIVGITGSGNYLQFPDGTTQSAAARTYVEEIIGINVDNSSSVLTTGVKGHRVLPYDCEIVGWTLTSNDTGSIDWLINWCTYANWPTTASTHSHNSYSPAFTSTNKATATSITPSEWTTYQFSEGDILEFEITSVTTCTDCNFAVRIRRTS